MLRTIKEVIAAIIEWLSICPVAKAAGFYFCLKSLTYPIRFSQTSQDRIGQPDGLPLFSNLLE